MAKKLPRINRAASYASDGITSEVLVDRFQGVADGVTFELAVARDGSRYNQLQLIEFYTGNGLNGERCGYGAAYGREQGEAAWARLLERFGATKVRETIEAGLAEKPHINLTTEEVA